MSASYPNRFLERIRAEYLEMPGLLLTREQLQRLCGVERATCQMVLDELVETKFLSVKAGGAYARATEGEDSHQGAKADLRAAAHIAKAS
jgi:hypothetical protein